MNNKGFTLIELLAVIVILAIIALIATPIILDLIADAREQAKKRSAELVYTGVQYAYTSALYAETEDTEIGEPDADAILGKFSVENASAIKDGENIKVTTNDKVYCLVTISGTGSSYDVKVSCGDDDDFTGTKYVNGKSVVTGLAE